MEDSNTATLEPTIDTGLDDSSAAPAVAEPRPLRDPAKPDRGGFVWGTGRRKSSVARVRIKTAAKEGEGQFILSGPKTKNKSVEEFFSEPSIRKPASRRSNLLTPVAISTCSSSCTAAGSPARLRLRYWAWLVHLWVTIPALSRPSAIRVT